MLGVVLCGGMSTRMGTDKGLMRNGSKSWAEKCVNKLEALNIPVVVSVNHVQMDSYSNCFDSKYLVQDSLSNLSGPLKGILSVHQTFPEEDLFVLACDMQDMKADILHRLYETYQKHRTGYDYFVYQDQEYYQALCGIYTIEGLSSVYLQHRTGGLSRFSMQYILETGKIKKLRITEDDLPAFNNYNVPLVTSLNNN